MQSIYTWLMSVTLCISQWYCYIIYTKWKRSHIVKLMYDCNSNILVILSTNVSVCTSILHCVFPTESGPQYIIDCYSPKCVSNHRKYDSTGSLFPPSPWIKQLNIVHIGGESETVLSAIEYISR